MLIQKGSRQEEELGAGRADELAYRSGFVTDEIVHDHDVAGMKRGDEDLSSSVLKLSPSMGPSNSMERRSGHGVARPGRSWSSSTRAGPWSGAANSQANYT
jgi:hypothetical protein